MRRKLLTSILAAMGLLVLILDTKTALLGAAEGIGLCISTVIPSLLPFFVLSILLTCALSGASIPFLRPIGWLCGVPKGAESILLIGMLGGYPAGAQSVTQCHRDGRLCRQDAQRMLAFCNLAGPAFLFGIVGLNFSSDYTPWVLWGNHIFSALAVAVITRKKTGNCAVLRSEQPVSLSQALQKSLRIMASVCGWIILFRILICFLQRWFLWYLPTSAQVAITGLLELSNGCCELSRIENEGLRFVIAAGLLSFGGICVTMQTASVTADLKLKPYFCGKLLQLLISLLLAGILQGFLFPLSESITIPLLVAFLIAVSVAVAAKFLHKKQKRYSISQPIGV